MWHRNDDEEDGKVVYARVSDLEESKSLS